MLELKKQLYTVYFDERNNERKQLLTKRPLPSTHHLTFNDTKYYQNF